MKNNSKLLYLLMAVVLIWLAVISHNISQLGQKSDTEQVIQQDVNGFSTDFTRIVEENSSSVPTVLTESATGTGFVYRQEGDSVYVLSAYHTVADASRISVLFGTTYRCEASLVGYDVLSDLAVLQIETPYQIPALKTGDATLLHRGEYVIMIGTPQSQDYAGSVRTGMIASSLLSIDNSITVEEERHDYWMDVIQISADPENGYSGSPVLNMAGEAVGMITMAPDEKLCFALSINEIRKAADQIISNGEAKHNLPGIREVFVRSLENYEKSNLGLSVDTVSGIYVQRVRESSPAYEAGIRSGDVVTAINDIQIDDLDDYLNVIYGDYESFTFTVLRNAETLVLGTDND